MILSNDKIIEVKDIVYDGDFYQFIETKYPYTFQNIKTKNVKKIEFDSINYSANIPVLKETFFDNDLPNGIYETIDDFYNKIPTSTEVIIGKEDGGKLYEKPRDLMEFKYKTNNKTVKKPFAIVYQNDLYFGVRGIDKHESKEMKGSFALLHHPNRYVRVKYKTDDFYYTDMPLQTAGSVIAGGAMGGALGSVLMNSLNNKLSRPVILINSEKKIYEVKNCKRFNEYFETRLNLKYNCENEDDYNIMNVRKFIIEK